MGRSFTIEIMRTSRQHFLSSTKAKTHSAFVFKPGAFSPAFIKHLFAKRLLCARNRGSTRNTAVMTRNVPTRRALTFYGGEGEDKHRKTHVQHHVRPESKRYRVRWLSTRGGGAGSAGGAGGYQALPSSAPAHVLSRS